MSMGGGFDPPAPDFQQRALTAKQGQYMDMQMDAMRNQEEIQDQQRKKIMREESTSAAKEASSRSNYRRRGAMGDAVTAPGYGGYRGRDMSGGLVRQYTPQPGKTGDGGAGGGGAAGGGGNDQNDMWRTTGPYGGQTFDQRYQARNAATRWNNQNVADSGEWWDSQSWEKISSNAISRPYR